MSLSGSAFSNVGVAIVLGPNSTEHRVTADGSADHSRIKTRRALHTAMPIGARNKMGFLLWVEATVQPEERRYGSIADRCRVVSGAGVIAAERAAVSLFDGFSRDGSARIRQRENASSHATTVTLDCSISAKTAL